MRLLVGLTLVMALACGKADEAKKESKDLADKAKDKAGALTDEVASHKDKAVAELKGRYDEARKYLGDADELAEQAVNAVKPYTDGASAKVESTIADGKQKAAEVAEMAKAVAPALADGVLFKPIYQQIDDDDEAAALDAAIGDMPRVEVVDGVRIGYRAHSKKQYLVVWRSGDHLVGFVYTSLTDILIEQVIDKSPRLIALVRAVL